MGKREGGQKAGEICRGAPVVYYDAALFIINCLWAPPPVFETTFLPTKKKKEKEEEQKQEQEEKKERKKKKTKLMKLNLNNSRGVNFNIVVFSTDSHFQGCSNVIICILKYIESSSESYNFFRQGKHISHTGIFEVIKLINMFAVWEVRGPDITQLIYIIERSKRSSLSGIIALH